MAVATQAEAAPEQPVFAPTQRMDAWWAHPLVFLGLFTLFVIWSTFRAFENTYYAYKNYLSPFYSPTIQVGWTLLGYRISPALLILIFPLSFRLSCYYYRKAIYRSYLADPFACAVPEPGRLGVARWKRYMGERVFPLAVQNFHRFAFYAAVVFIVILWRDTVLAFIFPDEFGDSRFGIGIGSVIFLVNIVLLTTYTFSCHSWRHLLGGGLNCYSCSLATRTRYGLWKKVSFLNESHGLWAMMSLCSVALTDFYVWLIASGRLMDARLI